MFDDYNRSQSGANGSYNPPVQGQAPAAKTANAPGATAAHDPPGTTPAPPQGSARPAAAAGRPPSVQDLARTVELLKVQQAADRNERAAQALDLRWRAQFGERMSSYKQAVLRVTQAIDKAQKGFTDAQVAQAQTDQLATQLLGLGASVLFAGGFEWIAGAGLRGLGSAAEHVGKRVSTLDTAVKEIGLAAEAVSLPGRVSKWTQAGEKIRENAGGIVEAVENPANAAWGGYWTNIRGAQEQQQHAERLGRAGDRAEMVTGKGQESGGSGSAVTFLAAKSEALEQHWQRIEQAFVSRSQALAHLGDEQWATFDVGAQERVYQGLLDQLSASASGVEKMENVDYVANVIEKYMWADWILDSADRDSGGRLHNFGTDIDLRLIKIGVEAQVHAAASATGGEFGLSEHWWQHSTDDWQFHIDSWARGYKGSILK